jgi:hypothetical protein
VRGILRLCLFFFTDQLPLDILDQINKCWLYLRAFFLSDITDGSGKYILQEAWQGNPLNLHRVESWPNQGEPSPTMWQTWRSHLAKKILSRGRRLCHPLGHWKNFDNTWLWYISLSDNRLYKHSETGWESFSCVSNRATLPIFTSIGTPSQRPHAFNRATVFTRGNTLLCSGHGAFTEQSVTKPNSFYDYLMALSADTWCFAYCDFPDDGQAIAEAISAAQR